MDSDPADETIGDEADSGWDEPPPPLSTWVKFIALITVVALLIATVWWISLL